MEKISVGLENYKVRSYQMDTKGRLTLTGIAGYLQESAGNHAHDMGFGFQQMSKSGLIWVLTRLKIIVHKYPHWSHELKAETWVVNREKFFSRRDFEIRSKSGEVLISAVSGWMLVDIKTKRPQLVESFAMNIDFFPERLAIAQELDKIPELNQVDTEDTYQVIYSDLDIVNHVNNIQYMRIILDAQPFELRSKYHVKSFEINYIAEALMNDELNILTQSLNDQHMYLHEIRRVSDKKVICRSIIEWEKD
jgi:medium-chain acyl-[acyl-carrier-protein] hydrolase